MVRPKILESKKSDGLSVYLEKKSITIKTEDGMSVLEVANEHGNSVRYEISTPTTLTAWLQAFGNSSRTTNTSHI